MNTRRASIPLGAASLACALLGAGEAARAEWWGPGCDPSRPAVAHHAGGVVLAPQPADGPVPCGVSTGFPGGETRIETGTCGAILYAPAGHMGDEPQTTMRSRGGMAISEDHGASWELSLPFGMTWHHNDLETFVDRDTGKLFFMVMQANLVGQVPW